MKRLGKVERVSATEIFEFVSEDWNKMTIALNSSSFSIIAPFEPIQKEAEMRNKFVSA